MNLSLHLSRSPGLPRAGIPASVSFRQWCAAALTVARRRRASELSLRLVDVQEGRQLNQQYRQRDYATNVLSFPAELAPSLALPLLGDLVVCVAVVEREANEQNKPLRNHYAHMTIHGVLHLLGYDHIDDAQAEQMEALERRALASLGMPDPYA